MGIFETIKNAFGSKAEQDPEAAVVPGPPSDHQVPQDQAADQHARADENQDLNKYTVQSGDTLWKISLEVYGDGSKYMEIFQANTGLLKSPDQVFPGQVLVIPEL